MGKTANRSNPSKINHPNSRKANQLVRFKHKEAVRNKKKFTSFVKLNIHGEKALWFKDNLNTTVETYTHEMLAELIEKYLSRFDEELKMIESRKPYEALKYASRRDLIKHTREDELREYNGCGIMIPNILNQLHLKELLEWNGELRYLQNLTFVRWSKKQLGKKSALT